MTVLHGMGSGGVTTGRVVDVLCVLQGCVDCMIDDVSLY